MFPHIEAIYRSHLGLRDKSDISARIVWLLQAAQHIEVDYPIWDFAADLALDHARFGRAHGQVAYAPDGGRLLSPVLALSVKIPAGLRGNKREVATAEVFWRDGDMIGRALISPADRHFPNGKSLLFCGGWTPGGPRFHPGELGKFGADQPTIIQEALQSAFLLSVINEERFVKKDSAATRQAKRSLQRSAGFAPIGWYRVSWNIGEAVKAKVAQSDPDNARPLHFCRAHWRRAKQGQPKAISRNDTPGWWCWVSECWKGHPAFGVKLHHYSPKMPSIAPAPQAQPGIASHPITA